MKKLLPSLLLFCVSGGWAQQYEVSYHDGIETSFQAVTYGSSMYYLEFSHKIQSCCGIELNLVKAKNGGQIIYRKTLSSLPYPETPILVISADHHLIVVNSTKMEGCDMDGEVSYIIKADTTGAVVWQKKLDDLMVEKLVALHDSSIVFFAQQKLWKWDLSGLFTASVNPQLGTVHSFCDIQDGYFLVNHTNGGGSNLRIFNSGLQGGNDVTIGTSLSKMQQLPDSSLLGLSADGILNHYNKNFSWQYGTGNSIPPSSFTIQSFCSENNEVFIAGTDNNKKLFYTHLDMTLSPNHGAVSNMQATKASAIAILNNTVNIVATGLSKHSSVNLVQLGKYGSLNGTYDIGVAGFTITKTNPLQSGGFVEIDADVTVKNFGNQPVNYFHVNEYNGAGFLECLVGLNKGYTISIAPGDSATVQTGKFFKEIHGTPYNPSTAQVSFCFFSSVPQNRHDINGDNDENCRTVTVLLTGLEARAHSKKEISVFPNPGHGTVNIEAEGTIFEIEITDLTGRQLFKTGNKNQHSWVIAHDLPHGVYLLRAHMGDRSVIEKLIVEQ